MNIKQIKERWRRDSLLKEVREEYLSNQPPRGIPKRDWYENFTPKEMHPYSEEYCADLRGIDFSGESLTSEHSFLEARLDYACFANSKINGADFQRAALNSANFSSCSITRATFHPTFAHKVDFSKCSINFSTFNGFNPMNQGPNLFGCSDLTSSSFEKSSVKNTAMNNVDFRQANFFDAVFTDCNFTASDLRGILINKETRFIRCNFRCAMLDRRNPFPEIFKEGSLSVVQDCQNIEDINWITDASFPSP